MLYDAGDVIEAVVPFMGESITDGTLATFLKSMLLAAACYFFHSLTVMFTCFWLAMLCHP